MNFRLLRFLSVAAVVMVVGCSDGNRQSSTEVENELSARVVSGSAMDSEALAFAEVTVWDGSGAKLASGTTDSVGRFSLALSANPEGGILVMVRDSADTLRGLAPMDDLVVRQGVATLNINGFSEAAIPPGFGVDPAQGFSPQTAWNSLHRGQDLMANVAGMKFDWNVVAFDPAFRPVSFKSDRTPSAYAGFLRAVEVRASREGKEGDQWLRTLEAKPGQKVSSDSLFAVDLARSIGSMRLSQAQTETLLSSFDSAAGHPGVWVDVWKDKQILSDPGTLQVRVPWASRPEYRELWRRLVAASGTEALAFEASLSPAVREKVRPGRAHEILATAVGGFIFPDSLSSGRLDALDSLMSRVLPQARLALEQIRPEAWLPSPPPQRDAQDKPARDAVADLLGFSLSTQFPMPWNYSAYQAQIDPGAWLRANLKPWSSSQAALDTLRATLSRHPEFRFPAAPLP